MADSQAGGIEKKRWLSIMRKIFGAVDLILF
jgi:hypothetical protein